MKVLFFLTLIIVATSAVKIRKGPKPNVRITGGTEATPHAYPYQAFLEIDNLDYVVYCGGVLISENYVLTSAYCIENAKHANVTLGMHSLTASEPTQLIIPSSHLLPHDLYYAEERLNDLALVELSTPATLSDAVQPVPLAARDAPDPVGTVATLSGWGLVQGRDDVFLSEVLQVAQVEVVSNEDCETFFGRLTEEVLCTEGPGVCHGDQGGPLVADGVLLGVVSFGDEFCVDGFPSVYSRVQSYLDWIGRNSDVVVG